MGFIYCGKKWAQKCISGSFPFLRSKDRLAEKPNRSVLRIFQYKNKHFFNLKNHFKLIFYRTNCTSPYRVCSRPFFNTTLTT